MASHQLTLQNNTFLIRLLQNFKTAYKCDVILIAKKDKKKIAAHKFILENASEYFNKMFNTKLNGDDTSNEYIISDIDGEILEAIVHSIYSQRITVNGNNCLRLYKAAHLMLFTEITEHCTKFMIAALTFRNCCEFLVLAQVYSNNPLIEKCVECIFRNFVQVTQRDDFLNLPPDEIKCILLGSLGMHGNPSEEEIFRAFQKWVEYDLENRKCCIKSMIVLIKLPLMPAHYFWQTVDPWIQRNIGDSHISLNVGKWLTVKQIDSELSHMTIPRSGIQLMGHRLRKIKQINSQR